MFTRKYTPTYKDGPVFRHNLELIEIASSRNQLHITGSIDFFTQNQLDIFIRELRLTWQEHLTLKSGKMPEKTK